MAIDIEPVSLRYIKEEFIPARDRIVSFADLLELRERFRKEGAYVGITSGSYDLVHPGHTRFIENLVTNTITRARFRDLEPVVFVGVNSDESTRGNKGYRTHGRPVIPEQDRMEVVAAFKGIDFVFKYENGQQLVDLSPDLLQMYSGTDIPPIEKVQYHAVPRQGGEVIMFYPIEGPLFSTTGIIRHIQENGIR